MVMSAQLFYQKCMYMYICFDGLCGKGEKPMPVEFLTDLQRQRYGTYTAEPSEAQLASYFYLDDTDRERLATKRGNHHRLGVIMWTHFVGYC